MKTIEIIVSPQGDAQLKTQGFAGRSCLEAGKFLEAALGQTVSDRLTHEFYAAAQTGQSARLSAGGERRS
jgi:hypothetical protein